MIDSSPNPPVSARFVLPRTTYVWLALLLLVLALPRAAPRPPQARRGDDLSAAAFKKYVAAEAQVRGAFGFSALLDAPSAARQRRRALREAVDTYRDLLPDTKSPGIPRRILILENAQGLALDTNVLAGELEPRLRALRISPADIRAESRLWWDLYVAKRVPAAAVIDYERRIRAMRLRTLEAQALHDLQRAAGNPARAAFFAERLERQASRYLSRAGVMALLLGTALLAGLVFLLIFLLSAARKRWERVARVATEPVRLGWGDLMDSFVFYLFLVRGVGFAVGALAGRLLVDATPHTVVLLNAALQLGTGVVALLYLASKARRRGVRLGDIGLTTRGALWANIGYGIAGYAATLPLVVALGWVAQIIFQHFPNTAPNPIMPLIASERDLAGRLIIFGMVAVAAPFFEELFFRGALFSGLRLRWGWVPAAVLASTVFALAHPPQDWLPIFGLGFGLATLREMRQSLVPAITAHLIQNTAAFVFLATLFDGPYGP